MSFMDVTLMAAAAVASVASMSAAPASATAAPGRAASAPSRIVRALAPDDSVGGTVMAEPDVNVRTAPCVEFGCTIDGQLGYGTRVAISCWLPGDTITGWGGTSDAWDLIVSPQVDGQDGWVADVWVNTGNDIRNQLRQCP